MMLGEYDYSDNFRGNENASWAARLVFVIFIIDMSVVLMNLILGLAVSDIENLKLNSAITRMRHECCVVQYMEEIFICAAKLFPCLDRLVTNHSSNIFDQLHCYIQYTNQMIISCILGLRMLVSPAKTHVS